MPRKIFTIFESIDSDTERVRQLFKQDFEAVAPLIDDIKLKLIVARNGLPRDTKDRISIVSSLNDAIGALSMMKRPDDILNIKMKWILLSAIQRKIGMAHYQYKRATE